jgi:hypothetical protein
VFSFLRTSRWLPLNPPGPSGTGLRHQGDAGTGRRGDHTAEHSLITRLGSPARRVLGPGYVLRMGTIEGLHHLDGAACTFSGASSGQRFTQVVTAEQACPPPRRHLTVCAI